MPKCQTIATFFAAVAGAALPALADDGCWAPMERWQSRDAAAALAESHGWTLRRIKIDDGCYELVVVESDGSPLEVQVDPATLKILRIHRENDGMEAEQDEHDGGGQ